jgi:hypothetical protein
VFEGGSPTTISPDGATVATNALGGRAEAALWNVTRPRHPARLAVLSVDSGALWGQAFSPDVSDAQPALAPGGRIVADGSVAGGEIHLWTLP